MKFIILDRDGVINFESELYIKSPAEWIPIPGSLEAMAALNRAGYHILIATNQAGVGRGYYDLEMLDQIHEKLVFELATVGGYVEEIFFCPHHPDDHCGCRKPQIGLFHAIQNKYPIDFNETYFIGDSLTDLQVAQRIGCKPLLVLTGNGEKTLQHIQNHTELSCIPYFVDLATAVKHII